MKNNNILQNKKKLTKIMALIYIFAYLFNIRFKIAENLLPAFAFNVTICCFD